ncbi:GtrA family protein [Kibdelosporangium aridum]|uniref:Putative flippase GtrA (Transmembrane translocase of bactoprenol-linked glucose) n=1 Tax=Kibdelosporangium aridum TaxID=2030 RepID=A0A1Y5XCJ0_KIBAR|nr:GtrA family protein [Kibdelosporangium aridum]SMC85931.1 Putative flippase GtrA (transmembrane translocase of bactoprenol-linked glucose) [Kibdelosporangium aridum]
MAFVQSLLRRLPDPVRKIMLKHRELLRFAVVGGICFIATNVVNYTLKLTILNAHPVTALSVAVIIATILSYILNREWSFHTRGGRERHHEAALFFLISGIGVALNSTPLFISRYVFDLMVPNVSLVTQEVADFFSGMILGTLIAMAFRWWAFKKWVFPEANARTRTTRTGRRLHAVSDQEDLAA